MREPELRLPLIGIRIARSAKTFRSTSLLAARTPDGGFLWIAAIQIGERLGPDATVATLMVDSGLRYVNTDVYRRG